jgi:hypothetical protein
MVRPVTDPARSAAWTVWNMNNRLLVGSLAVVIPLAVIGGWLWLQHRADVDAEVRAEVGACGACLPSDLTLDTRFSDNPKTVSPKGDRRVTTVREKLVQLRARCVDGRIYDGRGKEIRFYHIQEWGNPPGNYREIQERQRRELEDLESRYTVIRMYATAVPI